jgi:hypothetical protein
MNNENNSPGQDRDNNNWPKEQAEGSTPGFEINKEGSLETNGPNKDKPFNALNQDGSLPDMPDENVDGKGALDGTVGLGT